MAKAKNVGRGNLGGRRKDYKPAAMVVKGAPYGTGNLPFLWSGSVFFLTQVAGATPVVVTKGFRRIFGVGIVPIPDLDNKARRPLVDAVKAVLGAQPDAKDWTIANALERNLGTSTGHVQKWGVIGQARREMTEAPIAEAAMRKHDELGGKVCLKAAELAELVMTGPAKPECSLPALKAACYNLIPALKPAWEKEAEDVVRAYIDGGGDFVPRAKELANKILKSEVKPRFDFGMMAKACYDVIPGYRDKIRQEEDAALDGVLAKFTGGGDKSGAAKLGDVIPEAAYRVVAEAGPEDFPEGKTRGKRARDRQKGSRR